MLVLIRFRGFGLGFRGLEFRVRKIEPQNILGFKFGVRESQYDYLITLDL